MTIDPGPRFTVSPPTRLFDGCTAPRRTTFDAVYDTVADGSRSLWICAGNDNAPAIVTVNWSAALTGR